MFIPAGCTWTGRGTTGRATPKELKGGNLPRGDDGSDGAEDEQVRDKGAKRMEGGEQPAFLNVVVNINAH